MDETLNPHKAAKLTYVGWLLRQAAQRWRQALIILGISLLLNLCGLVAPRATQAILDQVVPAADFGLLAHWLLILLLVTLLQIALTAWRRLSLVSMSLGIDGHVVKRLCDHLLRLPAAFFRDHRAGDLSARLQDNMYIRHLFAGGLSRVIIDAVMVVVYVVVLFGYNFKLALVVLGCAALFGLYTVWVGPRLKRAHRRFLETKSAQEAQLIEMLNSIDLVKSMALERPLEQRWGKALELYLESNYRTQRYKQMLESTGTAIQFAGTGALLGYGAVLVLHGELRPGQLVAVSMYATMVLAPLLSLVGVWDEVQQGIAALDRIGDILSTPRESESVPSAAKQPGVLMGTVDVEDLHFHYGGAEAETVLAGVSFQVRPGECLAVVGQSGSGKTTLARLLLALYSPAKGTIRIDGKDLREWDLESYRGQVGVLLQENVILRGSILENISLGEPTPSLDRAVQAAHLAGADEFVRSMPNGYETVLGEQGLTVSGGQRQRLGLARALYRDPRLLILDEPTSALDGVSAKVLENNLDQILENRTTILIAHRLSTVRKADRILVLDRGRIVEQGSNEELLARGSLYRHLLAENGEVD
jgi:ATP-binding cassette subfamily B protein